MKFLLALIIVTAQAQNLLREPVQPEAKLPFVEYCKHFNYPVETHYITTDDGYILKFFRIQKKNTTIRKTGLTPILLQHGLTDSSDTWIINDEDKAPGFLLANRGYDVWCGNSRGNKHSRNHTHLNPNKDKAFWEFTFQHMAQFDLPAAFRYISNATQKKLHYIGHSQGTMQMHIAMSLNNPVIEGLIDKYFGFGPVAYVNHQESRLIKLIDKSGLLGWYQLMGIHQFLPSLNWFETAEGILFCHDFPHVCGDVFTELMDGDPSLDNYKRYDVVVGHDPSGTSVMNMHHWKQMVDHGRFQAFDYGSSKENMKHYNQTTPPMFELKNIKVPIRLFGGDSDLLADVQDIERMWSELNPNVKTFKKIYKAGHCTFIWGIDPTAWMTDLYNMLEN